MPFCLKVLQGSESSSFMMPLCFTLYYVAQNMTSAQLETLELSIDQNATQFMKFDWIQLILTLELTTVKRCNEGEKNNPSSQNSAVETASPFKATIPHKIL